LTLHASASAPCPRLPYAPWAAPWVRRPPRVRAHADASALKRKRRPPGRLAGYKNGDEGGGDDEAADANAAE
jgi:hypothetical protein